MPPRAPRKSRGLSRAARAARHLHEAHRRRAPFGPLPRELAPRSAQEAYAIQAQYVALRSQELGPIGGHKVALTTPALRAMCGVDQPFAGMMPAALLRRSPARLRLADYARLLVEFEIGIEMDEDLPAADAPFDRARVARAVGAVMPAFEVLDDRNADYAKLPQHPYELAADNAWNEGAVLGEPVRDWQRLDLAAVKGVARVNGKTIGAGQGGDSMGHPLEAVAWVANHLAAEGLSLCKGEIVITGSLVKSHFPVAGDVIDFTVERLGGVQIEVLP